MKPRLILLVLPLLLLMGAAACSDEADSGSSSGSSAITITQADGQTLTLESPPQRIVSLSAEATEILCALGAGDSLVAVEKFANCPMGSKAKPELDSFQPSLEAITAQRPDLVYVFSDQGGIVDALRRVGTTVLYLDSPESLEGVYERIELLGDVVDREDAAEDLVANMRKRQQEVVSRIPNQASGPRIFHELDPMLFTVRSDTFIGELYTLLKASNIADDASSPFPQLSAEAVVAADPEVIVLADFEAPDSVKSRPGWANISAVRDNRICSIDPSIVSQGGPRIIDGLEALAKCLYP